MDYIQKVLDECKNYNVIFIYVSKQDEVDTQGLIKELLRTKTVIVPKIRGDDIIPVKITSFDELKPGRFNIMEPVSEVGFDKKAIELFIIPGMKFDLEGNRKGRGQGYFDRFLSDVNERKIGLCFKSQIDEFSPNSWDVPMDEVIVVD